jgi:hypothetical protein
MIGFAGLRFFKAALVIAWLSIGATGAVAAGYSYLSPAQLAQLRALKIAIVLPAAVPSGYRLVHFEAVRNVAKTGTSSNIGAGDSEFGDADPDTSSFRRPFNATSPVLGRAMFEPYNVNGSWLWAATYVPIDRANPKALMNIEGTDTSALTRFFESMQRLPK